MDLFAQLQTLTETPGPSGYETAIAGVVRDLWQPYVESVEVDRVGSLIATKQGAGPEPRRRVMLAAHMDEIGLMVTKLVSYPDSNDSAAGFLRVTGVGGVDRRHLYGQLVTVHGKERLPGVIGALPDSMLPADRQGKAHNQEDRVVDVGLPIAALRELVSVGDFVSFEQPLQKLMNDQVAGKSLDNRASVAAVAVCLDYLQKRRHSWDVLAVATAQEETVLLGAYTSAFALHPDIAIALDVTFGKGPGAKDDGVTFELDGGPALGLGPNIHPGVLARLQKVAKDLELTVNTDPLPKNSGTDAIGLQVARAGIPTGLISIPLRYMHTMVETVALKDIERVSRLLGEFIAQLDDEVLSKMAAEMMDES
jgi:endoglucanase